MTNLISILRAVMRGHVVGCIVVNRGERFTLARWQDVGTIIEIGERGSAIRSFENIADLARHMRGSGVHYDAAIIDKVQEEVRFLEGKEAAAKLIDPPPFLKLAA